MDVRTQMLVVSKISRAYPKFLTRDVRANDPGTSAGYPSPNFLFGLFLFLTEEQGGYFSQISVGMFAVNHVGHFLLPAHRQKLVGVLDSKNFAD